MTYRTVRELIANPGLEVLPPDATVKAAAERMAHAGVGAVLVVDDSGIRGMFTERDAITRVMALGLDCRSTTLETVMTTRVLTVRPEDDVRRAQELMRDAGLRHLPVVSDDALIGLISVRDLLHVSEIVEKTESERERLWLPGVD
jgi:CBS domain-containing protein